MKHVHPPFPMFHTRTAELALPVFYKVSVLFFLGCSLGARSSSIRQIHSWLLTVLFFRSFGFFQVFPFEVFHTISLLFQVFQVFSGLSFSGLSYHLPPFFRSFRFFQVFLFQVFPFQVFHSTSLLLSLIKQTVSELIHFCYSLSS